MSEGRIAGGQGSGRERQADEARQAVAVRRTNIVWASVGLLLALGLILAFRLFGVVELSLPRWGGLLALTVAVQLALWWLPGRSWVRRSSWDRHYLYVPLIGVQALLLVYIFFLPEVRHLILIGWFVALLFMAGYASFSQTFTLSLLLAAGYTLVTLLQARRGLDVSLALELGTATIVLAIGVYTGFVFERLRRDRREMKRLRSELEELALTDSLTGLPNRRHFWRRLQEEVERVGRYGGSCCLALLDLDDFKGYNDALGHPAGDELLRDLARLMRQTLRETDFPARVGGEEFAVLMVNTGRGEGRLVLERLRRLVAERDFPHREKQPAGRVTISAGLASCPDDGRDASVLLRAADQALYRAKEAGRNRIAS